MAKLILCTLFALCLIVDIYCLKLDQCPPGYFCRKKIIENGSIRSIDSQFEEEWEPGICPAGYKCVPTPNLVGEDNGQYEK